MSSYSLSFRVFGSHASQRELRALQSMYREIPAVGSTARSWQKSFVYSWTSLQWLAPCLHCRFILSHKGGTAEWHSRLLQALCRLARSSDESGSAVRSPHAAPREPNTWLSSGNFNKWLLLPGSSALCLSQCRMVAPAHRQQQTGDADIGKFTPASLASHHHPSKVYKELRGKRCKPKKSRSTK